MFSTIHHFIYNIQWFNLIRYSVYTFAILSYLSYLGYLIYQLCTDYPLLNIKYNFLDTIDVPSKTFSNSFLFLLYVKTKISKSLSSKLNSQWYLFLLIAFEMCSKDTLRYWPVILNSITIATFKMDAWNTFPTLSKIVAMKTIETIVVPSKLMKLWSS